MVQESMPNEWLYINELKAPQAGGSGVLSVPIAYGWHNPEVPGITTN